MFVKIRIPTSFLKLAAKFKYGFFVGVHPRTSEALVANEHGTFRARTIKRLVEERRWDAAGLKELKGVPWDLASDKKIEVDIPMPQEEQGAPVPPIPPDITTRRMYITKKDIRKFGMTQGCPGCVAIANQTTPLAHSDRCRDNISKKLEETPEGAERVEKRRMKETEAMAEHGESLMKYQRVLGDKSEEAQVEGTSQKGEDQGIDVEQTRSSDEPEVEKEGKKRRLMALEREDMRNEVVMIAEVGAVGEARNEQIDDFTNVREDGNKWDFANEYHKQDAHEKMMRRPIMVVGGPRSTKSDDGEIKDKKMEDSMNFAKELYRMQKEGGRYEQVKSTNKSGKCKTSGAQ